jgi:hypothetical protein
MRTEAVLRGRFPQSRDLNLDGSGELLDDPQVGQPQRPTLEFRFRLHPVVEITAILTAAQLEQFIRALPDAFININGGGIFFSGLRLRIGHGASPLFLPRTAWSFEDSGANANESEQVMDEEATFT